MGESSQNPKLISTIIRLAHSLEMRVVAEGVETADQVDRLERLGCDYVQGFYYSRPISPQATELLLQATCQVRRDLAGLSKATSDSLPWLSPKMSNAEGSEWPVVPSPPIDDEIVVPAVVTE